MAKKPTQPKFNFPLDVLIQLGKRTCSFMERDSAEFKNYNIAATNVAAFRSKIDELENVPKDIELAGAQAVATEQKDALNLSLKNAIRGIVTRVEKKYGNTTAKYRRFGTKGLVDMNDSQLLKCAGTVKRVATEYLPELQTEGLTATILADLETKTKELSAAVDARDDAVANRDIATESRTVLGNSLYTDLIGFCSIGKSIWANNNEAKYNDYIVHNTQSGQPETAATT